MKFELLWSLLSEVVFHLFTPLVFYEDHNKFFTKIIVFPRTKFEQLPKGSFEEIYSPANISTLFQRCLLADATSRRGTTSNQR